MMGDGGLFEETGMPATLTPLRYPGGKSALYPKVKAIIEANGLTGCTYVEPFAGGAGLALKLLMRGDVGRIVINDFDPCIYAFWKCAVEQPDRLCAMIESTPITVEEWKRQKAIHDEKRHDDIHAIAFATLFLNRANVGGIIKGGIIGGLGQTGKYKIDARFNKPGLIQKIQKISSFKKAITVENMDAAHLLSSDYLKAYSNVFLNIDPPYVEQGSHLYTNAFDEGQHESLSEVIKALSHLWILTYDKCALVERLYSEFRRESVSLRYSISKNIESSEFLFYCHQLKQCEV